jgi:cytochrome c peroxidase
VTHESAAVVERAFHVTGLNAYSETYVSGADYGLFAVTGDVADKDRFKAPTLRNIARSAPYMHDGSIATLGEVVDFYAAGGRGDGRSHPGKSAFVKGFTLTAQERQDLLDFLSSLTDEEFLSDPRYSDPFSHGGSVPNR